MWRYNTQVIFINAGSAIQLVYIAIESIEGLVKASAELRKQ